MNGLTIKDKLSDEEIKTFKNIDGRFIMIETLKNKGRASFPGDTIPLHVLINTGIIFYGWKFSKTVERYAEYYLFRFYRRNNYTLWGPNRNAIEIPASVKLEIDKYEEEWQNRLNAGK